MKRFILIIILCLVAWQGYGRYQTSRAASAARQVDAAESPALPVPAAEPIAAAQFKCDGRTYCSQMTSCAEATFFLNNCLGVKMDGDNDGVPCEQQWCQER
jgi:predicted negative regulator of RcsB-dependent stress response